MRVSHILLLALLVWGGLVKAEPETVSGTFTMENPVYKELLECRERKGYGTLEVARCYEKAVAYASRNISNMASLSLVYLKSDLIGAAKTAMNRTVMLWLEDMQRLTTAEERGNISYVELLRRAFDEAREKNNTDLRDRAIEMGLLIAKKFEVDHKPTDAHAVYYGFLAQLGVGGDNVVDFHRRTGNIIALSHTGNYTGTSLVFRIAEAIGPIVDGLTTHILSYGHISKPIRRMCGIEFTQSNDIRVRDIVKKLMSCIERWGNYSTELAESSVNDDGEEVDDAVDDVLRQTSVLKYTPLHRLAALDATYVLNETLEFIGSKTVPADRFGRGLLHYAAAAGADSAVQLLVKKGARWDKEDKGRVQPAHLGCTSPGFKEAFEDATADGACDGLVRNRHEDDDIDVTDDSGTDGGWNPHKPRPNLHCDFDVRDMSRTYQHDINIAYMQANHPLVLRNAFYEEDDGPRREWRRRGFNKSFHDVLVRQEVTPSGERWGIGSAKIVTISEFLNTSKINDGTVASVVVDNAGHRLDEMATWTPPSLKNKKNGATEVTYFDLDSASPTLIISKEGSKSHHHVRAFMTHHTVFYGHKEFTLLPPRHARTVRGQLDDSALPLAKRCNLYTGDVLLIPELWSASWVSKANGVSTERSFYRKGAQD